MDTYLIQVRGQVDVNELNLMSPHHMTPVRIEPTTTHFTICTDQSGMIGLLRHLHNLGLTISSIACQTEPTSLLSERKES